MYINITYNNEVTPRVCAKAISTRNPDINAKNNLLFEGIAIAQ